LLLALGDSYSSGEGAGEYDPATVTSRNSCHRSLYAWPRLVANRLDLQPESLACSGARTPEVTTDSKRTNEPERHISQISRIATDRRPEILTITIGGNDVGFAAVLGHCVGDDDCVKRYTDSGHDEIQAKIDGLERTLQDLYAEVQRAVPGTRVVVVDYPRIFPPVYRRRHTANCAAWDRISDHEARWLNARGQTLDAVIARAASEAHVEFVEVSNALDGHELNCGGDPYVNPLKLRLGWPPYMHESFHPTREGQAGIAEIVADKLGG
jgi:lysophospholipase L1-like esterase